ncbi:LptF/LptG family permease, partial [Salmonella enterica subsp. enterica serovar Enteritidis]|nr:LptF/LptG family permease [Salmonella enterica subsp. enterica serovar Enteritidis]
RYELGTNNAKYNQASFEKYRITLEKPASEKITETNVETQTTAKLLAHTQKPEVKAELGYRFTMPWLIIIAAMLATPLAQVRPRQGRWLRLLPSVLIFASCAISIISLRTAIGKERISEYAYIWLTVGFIAFALLLNWQSRVVHRVRYRRHSRQLSPGGQP